MYTKLFALSRLDPATNLDRSIHFWQAIIPNMKVLFNLFASSWLFHAATAAMAPCLDEYATRLGITALPNSASNAYKNNFCQYTKLSTANGPIQIFGGSQLSSLQLYRARKILEFYLTDVPGSQYGSNKNAIRNKLGANNAKLDMPNGAHQQPGAGTALQGQELYWAEVPVEGDNWFMNNNMDHRDAALEEILHLVHDSGSSTMDRFSSENFFTHTRFPLGIGVDGPGGQSGGAPAFQAEIRAATNNAQPTWLNPPGKGIWGENERAWVRELAQENSLSQEYLAAVIDVYYGLWDEFGAGMWGIYKPSTRANLATKDPMGNAVVEKFFSPYITYMAMLSPQLSATFSMTYASNQAYTKKSRYYIHATLLGNKNSNLVGNDQDNCLGPNAGTNAIDGKSGTDVILFQGNCNEYSISCSSSTDCTITDGVNGRDGTTLTSNIESLAFRDGDYNTNTGTCTPSVSNASERCWQVISDIVPTPLSSPTAPVPSPTASAPTPTPPAPTTPAPTPTPPAPSPPTSDPLAIWECEIRVETCCCKCDQTMSGDKGCWRRKIKQLCDAPRQKSAFKSYFRKVWRRAVRMCEL